MKRDMDLVRTILQKLEEAPYEGGWVNVEIGGHSEEEVSYHVALLHEAGLIRATNLSSTDFNRDPARLGS